MISGISTESSDSTDRFSRCRRPSLWSTRGASRRPQVPFSPSVGISEVMGWVLKKMSVWVRLNTYRYIFNGMNIHLPAILGFTRYQGFDPSPYDNELMWNDMPVGGLKHFWLSIIYGIILPIDSYYSYFSRWLKPPTSMKWWYNCNILQ